ncbi:MAG: hypothetical protein IM618_20040 [Cytophagales bacterium]|jgi:hypothetical protein|nr:hypothetical protein [Cytophagales bacterium]MCA6375755.1 hypothetical protein [Cytophagales bacterium]MCA6385381.1 hypothetical protein [Cytophagales bacterium]
MNKLLNIFFPIILFSLMGCSLSNKILTKNDGTGPYYPPSGLAGGVYIVEIRAEDGALIRNKVMVMH